LYPGGLAQHIVDKSLRAVNLHVSGSTLFLFVICQFFTTLFNLNRQNRDPIHLGEIGLAHSRKIQPIKYWNKRSEWM